MQTGEGKNGIWKRQDIILELESDTSTLPPKKLCVGLWNDKIIPDMVEGFMLKVSFEIDSREYNNKWFTNLKAWKVEELSSISVHEQRKKDFFFDAPEDENDFHCFDSDLPFNKVPF